MRMMTMTLQRALLSLKLQWCRGVVLSSVYCPKTSVFFLFKVLLTAIGNFTDPASSTIIIFELAR